MGEWKNKTLRMESRALRSRALQPEEQLLGKKRPKQKSKQTEGRLLGLKVESEH